MVVISQASANQTGGGVPSTLTGSSSTAAQAFTPQPPIPGSKRLDGQQFTVRAGGNVTPNASSTVAVSIQASYPSGQYPNATITSASLTNNVATYIAANNFVVGQSVKTSGCTTSTLNTTANVASANSTQFTLAITHANVSNEAESGAAAAVQPVQIYSTSASSSLTAGTTVPWECEVRMQGDQGSGQLNATGNAMISGVIDTVPTYFNLPAGSVNFVLEPPVVLQAAITYGTGNTGHTATLKQLVVEQ